MNRERNVEYSCVQFDDLSDEVLLMILEKLDNIDVLYSFHGINERFNQIARHPMFTSSLNFVKCSSNLIMNRFCLQILPDISMNIRWLYLQSSSVKDILGVGNYPNLSGLGLYNIKEKTSKYLLNDKKIFSSTLKKQIRELVVIMDSNRDESMSMIKMCCRIFSVFKDVRHLTFCDSSSENVVRLLFDHPSRYLSSSKLLFLNIQVQRFSHLLSLLDGRFSQLKTLIVDVLNPSYSSSTMSNKFSQMKVDNLQSLIFSCPYEITSYDEIVEKLRCPMTNLEHLTLDLTISTQKRFVDGNDLKKNLFSSLPKLNSFEFRLCSRISFHPPMNFFCKEDLDETFLEFAIANKQIFSSLDYLLEKRLAQYHIYSYRSAIKSYDYLTNHFPGGLYSSVRQISLYDEYPFEHRFFLQLSQSFPSLEDLSLTNHQAQKWKESNNCSIIQYNHLRVLNLHGVHDDYLEEFLFDRNTSWNENIRLSVDYQSIERVTENFTRDDTRINCAKIKHISLSKAKDHSRSQSLIDYFPSATFTIFTSLTFTFASLHR